MCLLRCNHQNKRVLVEVRPPVKTMFQSEGIRVNIYIYIDIYICSLGPAFSESRKAFFLDIRLTATGDFGRQSIFKAHRFLTARMQGSQTFASPNSRIESN